MTTELQNTVTEPETKAPPTPPKMPDDIYSLGDHNLASIGELVDILQHKRPHGSKTEKAFIRRFIDPLPGMQIDKYGNRWTVVGNDRSVLWSCHTDTVHVGQGGMQTVNYWGMDLFLPAAASYNDCLGADDGAGVWIMLQMIRAKKPGLYIFHRNEEHGRHGSLHIAKKTPKMLEGVKYAIAFDRKDRSSIITYQTGMRCCSEDFSKSLAEQLNKGGLDYKSDDTGSYTDTASYVDLVGECTNLSVGYSRAHSKDERLNVQHLVKLRDAILLTDLSKLVEKRKAGEVERKSYAYSGGGEWEGHLWISSSSSTSTSTATKHGNRPGDQTMSKLSSYKTTEKDGRTYCGLGWWKVVENGWANWVYHNESMGRETVDDAGALERVSLEGGERPGVASFKEKADTDIATKNRRGGGHDDFQKMIALIREMPMAVGTILEQYGYDFRMLNEEIMDMYGASRGN